VFIFLSIFCASCKELVAQPGAGSFLVDGAPPKVVTCSILFGASSSSLYFHLITVPSSLEPDFSIETNKSAYLDTGDVNEGNQF
jgi:hypothetical protein